MWGFRESARKNPLLKRLPKRNGKSSKARASGLLIQIFYYSDQCGIRLPVNARRGGRGRIRNNVRYAKHFPSFTGYERCVFRKLFLLIAFEFGLRGDNRFLRDGFKTFGIFPIRAVLRIAKHRMFYCPHLMDSGIAMDHFLHRESVGQLHVRADQEACECKERDDFLEHITCSKR